MTLWSICNVTLTPVVSFPGVTTVLTMTFLGLEARTDLPQVGYPTALDYFVFISFMSIFATVAQVRRQRAGKMRRPERPPRTIVVGIFESHTSIAPVAKAKILKYLLIKIWCARNINRAMLYPPLVN